MDKEEKTKKIIIIVVLVIGVITLIGSLFCLLTMPKISLKDKEEITLIYPEKYKEPGYKAKTIIQDITKNVKIKGKVDSNKIGTYKLTYQIKNLLFTSKVTRTVKVIDNEPPVITLKGNEETVVCPNKTYEEEGYEVTDNYSKDLNSKVDVNNSPDEIIYIVKDKAGNETKKVRKIKYEDKDKPELKLKSGNVTIYVGNTYKEPGYTATDKCDGDISKNVKVSGSVNNKKTGTYTLTYTVKDASGNEAKVTRKVTVKQKTVTQKKSTNSVKSTNSLVSATSSCSAKGAIYLTFDDGPQASTTTKILDTLKSEGVKATFFVTNSGSDSLISREYNEGHSIGLHTASHTYSKVYASDDAFFADLQKVSDRVKRITGIESKIIRFPGGSSNTVSRHYSSKIMTRLTKEVVNRGYKYYDWNVDSDDAGSCRTASCVYNNVTSLLSKNKCNMVLMHDVKSYTAAALKDVIEYGKSHGYTFKKIDSSTPMVRHNINN